MKFWGIFALFLAAILASSVCEARSQSKSCMCPMMYDPVCGTDGKTYSNKCAMKCGQNGNSGVSMSHKGECQKEYETECGSC